MPVEFLGIAATNDGSETIASKTEKPAAYQAGGAEADIYCLWGEPLSRTAEQIESVRRAGSAHPAPPR